MYTPNSMRIAELGDIHNLIDQFSFGILFSKDLSASHLPFVLYRDRGANGTLYSHLAKANPHWKQLDNQEVLVVFSSPDAYISPSWYSKLPAVPTWNYAAIHAKGRLRLLPADETLEVVNETTRKHEPQLLAEPADIVTQEVREKLLRAIVGISIEITHIEGKQKLSQNKSQAEQLNICKELRNSGSHSDKAFAEYMEESVIRKNK